MARGGRGRSSHPGPGGNWPSKTGNPSGGGRGNALGGLGDGFGGGFAPVSPDEEAANARRQFESRIRHELTFQLCQHLKREFSIDGYEFRDMGWDSAVIVDVIGCDSESDDATAIRAAAEAWRHNHPAKHAFTTFTIGFNTPWEKRRIPGFNYDADDW